MKEIFREYGAAVIAACVALAILFFFLHISAEDKEGVAQLVGNAVEQKTTGQLAGEKNTSAFDEYRKEKLLQIRYDFSKPIYAGEQICISEYFVVEPETGSFTVKGVCDSDGNVYPVSITEGKSYLTFEKAGIYRIYLEAEGSSGKKQKNVISFPVMSLEEEHI